VKRLITLLVSIGVVIFLAGSASALEWQPKVMLDVSQCELLDGTIANIAANAQIGPGVAVERIGLFTYRIYFASDDIPTVLSPGQYDLYYVDFDIPSRTCGIAHPVDVICATPLNTSKHDEAPGMSGCGNYLFYLQLGPAGEHDHQIWYAEKDGSGLWSNPRKMPALINSGHDEHAGTMRDGKFYFTSNNRDGSGVGFQAWAVDFDPVTNTAANLEKLMFGTCPSDDPIAPPSDPGIVHDPLANASSVDFLWADSGIAWNTTDGGYISGIVSSWYEAIISGVTYDPVDIPVAIFRIYRSASGNHIFGFTDTPPASSNYHYSNIDLGIYIHSTGSIRPSWDVNNSGYWNRVIPVGYYDIRIQMDGDSGTFAVDIQQLTNWDDPESDFESPIWSVVENRAIGGPYHIQINPYNTYSAVYDVWATTGVPAVPQPYSPYLVGPCLVADEDQLYYHSSLLPGAISSDIYYSDRIECVDGNFIWSDPVRLGENVNGSLSDLTPVVTEDMDFLFFTSNSAPAPSTAHKIMYCERVRTTADISGIVTDVSLGGPASDIPVSIYEVVNGDNNLVGESITSVDGTYSFTDLDPGTYLVEVAAPFGYAASPESHTAVLDGSDIYGVDFDLTVIIADISGTVTDVSIGEPAAEILVALYSEINDEHILVDDVVTSVDGTYEFADLAPGTYVVEAVAPIGFIVDPDNHTVALDGVDAVNADFGLIALSITNESMGKEYWKHQVNVVIKGRGHLHEEEVDITTNFPALIYQHFYEAVSEAIQVEGVTYAMVDGVASAMTIEDMHETLSSGKNMTRLDKAKMHYLALLLNVVSNKVGQGVIISTDGIRVAQAIKYIDSLINAGSDDDLDLARSISEDINEGIMIASDVIPGSVTMTYFGKSSTPVNLVLEQNYPNPFNPSTSIMFNVDRSGDHYLAVYDVSGRLVKVLSSGQIASGSHTVHWDGTNNLGASVASAVYFYKLKAGDREIVKKMVLLR